MSAGERDQLMATMQARLTRVLWLWALGEVWFTGLIVGAVIVLLRAR
jgi:hypothetical protein